MSQKIPHYFRYGETEPVEELEFIHCEPIFGRIQEQSWEISPHRHDSLHQLLLLNEGVLNADLDTQPYQLIGPTVVLIPAGHVHGFQYDETAQGKLISISDALMRNLGSGAREWISPLLEKISILKLDQQSAQNPPIIYYLCEIDRELNFTAPGRDSAIASLLRLVLVTTWLLDVGSNALTFESCFR